MNRPLPPDPPAPWQLGLVLSVAVCAIATAPLIIRYAMDSLDQPQGAIGLVLAAARLGVAAVVLAPNWRDLTPQTLGRSTLMLATIAGLCLGLHFATWISSLAYTSIAASTLIVTTNPIWVALISYLGWREPLGRGTLVGIGLALAGAAIVGWDSPTTATSPNPALGNALALVGSWSISLYLVLGQQVQRQGLSTRHYATWVYTVAALGLLPLPWLWGVGYGGYPGAVYGAIVLLALGPQLVGHTSLNWAMRWLSPTVITLVILGEPLGASVLGFWLLGEVPTPAMVGGGVLIGLGIGVAAMSSSLGEGVGG